MSEEILEFNNHQIRLKRRAYQRTLRVHVKRDGQILVTTGYAVTQKSIMRFLADTWDWIEKHRTKAIAQAQLTPRKKFIEGESFLFLGVARTLHFEASHSRHIEAEVDGAKLKIHSPKWPLQTQQIAQVVRRFYEAESRLLLASRVEVFSKLMGLYPKKIKFRCQRTRWGSCSTNGTISLNWRLLAAPLAVIDYVVVHELAHLQHPNHSAHFWRLVMAHSKDFRQHHQWLKENSFELDFLLPSSKHV